MSRRAAIKVEEQQLKRFTFGLVGSALVFGDFENAFSDEPPDHWFCLRLQKRCCCYFAAVVLPKSDNCSISLGQNCNNRADRLAGVLRDDLPQLSV